MKAIPLQVLIELRELMQANPQGSAWVIAGPKGVSRSAQEFIPYEEIDDAAGRYSFWALTFVRPAEFVTLGTADRSAWHALAPLLREFFEKHDIYWTESRTFSGRNSFWQFSVQYPRGRLGIYTPMVVCRSADPRMLNPDLFKEARKIDPSFGNGAWGETERGFYFTCYKKSLAVAMRAQYADCKATILGKGKGGDRSYTLTVDFPDVVLNRELSPKEV